MNSVSVESLEFSGGSRSDCQRFIRDVRRAALAAGKARDDEWMADIAGACFIGDALDWHIELDEEIQQSWKMLERAMLRRFAGEPSTGT